MKTFVSRYLQRTALAMICATLSLPLCFVYAQELQPDQQLEVPTSDESMTLARVWRPWASIAGPPGAKSSLRPAAAGRATGELDIVDVTLNGEVWHRWWSAPTGWALAWRRLDQPPVGTFAGPAIAGRSNGVVDVFVIGRDGNVWHRWMSASTDWTPWISIGAPPSNGTLPDGIAATGRVTGELDVIVTNQAVLISQPATISHKWWSASTRWRDWENLGELVNVTTYPAVAGRKSGELDVFVTTWTGVLFHRWRSATTNWSPWKPVNIAGQGFFPAAAGRADGTLDVVSISPGGTLLHAWWGSLSGWHDWGPLGKPYAEANIGSPGIAALRDGQLYVFVKDGLGDIYFRRWE